MHRFARHVALACVLLAGCAQRRVREPVPVALEIASPHARDLPAVAVLRVRRQYVNMLFPEPVAVEGDRMVSEDLIVFDPRARPIVVPALGEWHEAILYAPAARPVANKGPEVRAARRAGILAVPWPAPAGSVEDLVMLRAEGRIDSGSADVAVPFLLRRRSTGLYVGPAPGWTTSFPGGDLAEHLRLAPGRWDSPLLEVPRQQEVRWAGEDHCSLTVERPADAQRKEVAYLFVARADEDHGTVAWLYGRTFLPREEYPFTLLSSLTRVVDATNEATRRTETRTIPPRTPAPSRVAR